MAATAGLIQAIIQIRSQGQKRPLDNFVPGHRTQGRATFSTAPTAAFFLSSGTH
jgi:hypothetical protein